MTRRSFLQTTSAGVGAAAAGGKLNTPAAGQSVQAGPAFRRPKTILPCTNTVAEVSTRRGWSPG